MVQASGNFTSRSAPSLATVACTVAAVAVAVALIRAFGHRAVESCVCRIALTGPVHTDTAVGAIVGASSERAIFTNESWFAEAGGVVAEPLTTAIIRASTDGAIEPGEALITGAVEVDADTVV